MSKRYSIDSPGMDADSDFEEDIVLGNFNPTSMDRDLLRADEAVLNDINSKSKSKLSFFSGRGSQYNKLSGDRPTKKVGFSGAKPSASRLNSKSSVGKAGRKARRGGYAQLNSGNRDSEESDSDYPSDIEIDIRAEPRRMHQGPRRMHTLLLIFVLFLALWFFYTNFLTFGTGKAPSRKTMLSNGTHEYRPTTVVVSLDGFHPHYINEQLTPNLHELFTQNSGSPYMTPSFPSSTFPNHWTLVTGLYPANHGIIGNTFFDEDLKKQFFNTMPAQSLNPAFWGGQPIWQTASFQGVLSAIHMWPGSEVEWSEEAPVVVDKFNSTELLTVKSNRVLSWLDMEVEERPELIMAYVPTVDTVGHAVGIAGDELMQALKDVDQFVGDLMSGLDARNLSSVANLVIVSDHGMAPTSNDRLLYLDDLVEMSNIEHVDGWPLMGLRPKPSLNLQALYANLKDAENQFGEGKWNVYLRENLPAEWKFGGSQYNKFKNRIAPLWLIPKVGWTFTTKEQMQKLKGDYKPHGIHGYNNTEVLMRALFLAKGPYFSNDLYEPFENVGLYNIICDTLGIQPAKNDGPPARSLLKLLPANWTDAIAYPDLPFKTEVLIINSTYDILFGNAEGSDHEVVADVQPNEAPPAVSQVAPAMPSPTDSATPITVAGPTPEAAKPAKPVESAEPAEPAEPAETATPTSTTDSPEETSTDGSNESEPSWWEEWLDYAKGKASDAKDWVVDQYHSLTEHKTPEEDSSKEEASS